MNPHYKDPIIVFGLVVPVFLVVATLGLGVHFRGKLETTYESRKKHHQAFKTVEKERRMLERKVQSQAPHMHRWMSLFEQPAATSVNTFFRDFQKDYEATHFQQTAFRPTTVAGGIGGASQQPSIQLHFAFRGTYRALQTAFLELETSVREQAVIDQAMDFLEEAALSQPTVMVHRDFHSRNLMLLDDSAVPALGVIDFQDAVHGPYSYDVVSLLRDCYLRWEPETVIRWALTYWQAARADGLLADVSEAQFLRDFDLMGLQRHLKVMGIFCRLSLRDNKSQYLADMPLVIQYFLEVSRHYPELGDFVEWFNRRALPIANQRLPKSAG